MKTKGKLKKVLIITGLVLALIIVLYIVLDSAVRPAVLSLAETKLAAMANLLMNDAVGETFGSGIGYSDLVDIEKDETGKIRSISANAVNINSLVSKVTTVIQLGIAEIGRQGIDIPIGTAIGGTLFTGRGPSINVRVEPVGSANAVFLTGFEEAGINQTRHLIYLEVKISMKMVIANTVEQVDYSSTLLISDTVIVGEIPDSYIQFGNAGGAQSLAPMLLMDKYSQGNLN